MNEHATNLRRTRANMMGTVDDEHYWHCHAAADAIDALSSEVADLRQSLIGGVEGVKAGRDLTKWAAANDKKLQRKQTKKK